MLSHDRTSAELLRYVDMFQGKATVHKIGQPTKWKHVKPFRVWHRDDPAIQKLIAVENLLHNANV